MIDLDKKLAREFLAKHNLQNCQITKVAGDASFRSYYRVLSGGKKYILMSAPPKFEDVKPFIKIDKLLCENGFLAPKIHQIDSENGFLLLEDFGEDTQQGFIEITPFATRRPNIPDMAYENQLNGWVLVIFNVSSAGKPHSIKVLDASPKGIFEEEVIKAIKQWRYNLKGISGNGQDKVMTQKIELNWQNHPQNLAYED